MGLFKFMLTVGKSSIGETTKVLANDYNMFGGKDTSQTNKKDILEMMYHHRQNLNRRFPEPGDNLQLMDFNGFYERLSLSSQSNFEAHKDLATFIFLILYQESRKFRSLLKSAGVSTKEDVFEVIYETVYKYASKAVISTKRDFILNAKSMVQFFETFTSDWM